MYTSDSDNYRQIINGHRILPILLYGSELWGFKPRENCELIHRLACKRFLCVNRTSSNNVVLGDCGRYPIYVESAMRCIKYWFKLLKLPNDRYVKICYRMLSSTTCAKYFNWANEIEHLLCSNGFGHVWLNQGVQNERLFLHLFCQRLKDNYLQGWYSKLDSSDCLSLYNRIKNNYDQETYISILNIRKFRHCYAQLRSGLSHLEVTKKSYRKINTNDWNCKVCSLGLFENEFHFLLVCPVYADLRANYIAKKYYTCATEHKLNISLSCKNENVIKSLANYVYHATIRKKMIMQF